MLGYKDRSGEARDAILFSVNLPPDMAEALSEMATDQGVSKKEILVRALRMYGYENKPKVVITKPPAYDILVNTLQCMLAAAKEGIIEDCPDPREVLKNIVLIGQVVRLEEV